MKKIISLLLTAFIVMSLAVGCGSSKINNMTDTKTVIRLGGLKGPTSMGMVKLLDDAENKKTNNSYEFTMAASADELTPKFMKGEIDILAVPANLGAILYNNSNGAVKMLAINTLGVLYIVEKGKNTINSISDLKGKTVYATGKGSTPELALNYLLKESGLEAGKDVILEWKSEPTEITSKMANEEYSVAMLPEPFVTVAKSQVPDLHTVLDLNEEWTRLDNKSRFITAGLIVRKDFAEKNPEAVSKFLEEYSSSAKYVNDNTAEAAALIEKYGIVKAAVAEKAVPACNIVCITGQDMKNEANGYLSVLYKQNAKSVGGNMPGDDFYLIYE